MKKTVKKVEKECLEIYYETDNIYAFYYGFGIHQENIK